ncbi:MAG: hypothetical protein ABS69_06305 [Nitrosomonadales bacterium SCN 54-20]|nr:MAG: hypothetical protein ABS69_06305 [Nitrosomonadales bacterium SCN 54-20]
MIARKKSSRTYSEFADAHERVFLILPCEAMGKEGYCLLYKPLQQRLSEAFLKRVHMAPIQKLITFLSSL